MRLVISLLVALAQVLLPGAPAPAEASAAAAARSADGLVYGVIVDTTNPRSMRLAREAGFTHAKMIIFWDRLEPRRGRFAWADTKENDLDNVMKAAQAEDLKLVVRVDGVPDWAGGSPANADTEAVARFYEAMAEHGRGVIVGYEILNEPNLPFEWGGAPDSAGYTRFLKAAYRGVKKADPDAVVIGGGVSPATGGFGGTMEDFDFLDGMYRAGAKGYMDALAVHNYGGNLEPEHDPADCTICFRRAERYRQLMVDHGDASTAVWATEFGWLLDPGRDMGQYDWMRVSATQQADYIVRAFRYAQANWPWMEGMLLSNLDASTSGYHNDLQNGLPWFAILNGDHSPRPAYQAFKKMREADGMQVSRVARRRASNAEMTVPAPERGGGSTDGSTSGEPASASQAAAIPTVPPAERQSAQPEPPASLAGVPGTAPTEAGPARFRVSGTDGEGLSLRAGPSPTARRLKVLPEGTLVEVLGGEESGGGLVWRQVREPSGSTGWVASQYLVPA